MRLVIHYLVVVPKLVLAPVRTTGAFSGEKKETTHIILYILSGLEEPPVAYLETLGEVTALEPERRHADVCVHW